MCTLRLCVEVTHDEQEARSRGRDETEAEQRREQSWEKWRDESRAETRAEERREQTRDESRESRAPAETRRWVPAETRTERRLRRKQSTGWEETRLETETQSESERRRAMTAKCSSSCGALCYIERAQRLPSCSTWRVVSTSTPTGAVRGVHLSPLTRATRALLNKTRDNTAYMYSYIYLYTRIDGSQVSIFTYFNIMLVKWA